MKRIILAVTEPRKFVTALNMLKKLDAPYIIPDSLPVYCRVNDIVVTDSRKYVLNEELCSEVLIVNEENLMRTIEEAYLKSMGAFKENASLVIGVDLGEDRHAYVVIANGVVLETGKTQGDDIIKAISLRREWYDKVIVKIGLSKSVWTKAFKLAEEIASSVSGVSIEFVNEEFTTSEKTPHIKDGDHDVNAALRIALKQSRKY